FGEREYPSRRFSTLSKVAKRSRSFWKDSLLRRATWQLPLSNRPKSSCLTLLSLTAKRTYMRILLDVLEPTKAGVPSRLAFVPRQVIPHSLIDTLGELLDAAEAAGFDVLVTVDRCFRYEQ